MSKRANSGELRTRVYFYKPKRKIDEEGFAKEVYSNVFGPNKSVFCKWVNAHSTEVFTNKELQLHDVATLTCRYSPLINEQQIVYKVGDDKPYEIISIDNVREENLWLEIKIQRMEESR